MKWVDDAHGGVFGQPVKAGFRDRLILLSKQSDVGAVSANELFMAKWKHCMP